jgi:hypothetical protein
MDCGEALWNGPAAHPINSIALLFDTAEALIRPNRYRFAAHSAQMKRVVALTTMPLAKHILANVHNKAELHNLIANFKFNTWISPKDCDWSRIMHPTECEQTVCKAQASRNKIV